MSLLALFLNKENCPSSARNWADSWNVLDVSARAIAAPTDRQRLLGHGEMNELKSIHPSLFLAIVCFLLLSPFQKFPPTPSHFFRYLCFTPSLATYFKMEALSIEHRNPTLRVYGTVCQLNSLFGLSEPNHLVKVGWLDTLQGRSAAHVTSTY